MHKEGKGTDNYRGCVHWQCGCRRYDKGRSKKAVDAYVDSIKDTSFSLKGANSSFDTTAQEMSVSADTDAAADEALSVCHEGSLIDRFVESEELKRAMLPSICICRLINKRPQR